jgi:hypothetical protein
MKSQAVAIRTAPPSLKLVVAVFDVAVAGRDRRPVVPHLLRQGRRDRAVGGHTVDGGDRVAAPVDVEDVPGGLGRIRERLIGGRQLGTAGVEGKGYEGKNGVLD